MSPIDMGARGVEQAVPADDLAGNGPRLPDASYRRVCIPVSIRNGKVEAAPIFGFPDLKDINAELFVPAHAFKNPSERDEFTAEETREVLPAGEVLLCRVGWNRVPHSLRARCKRADLPHSPRQGAFIEIVIDDALRIRSRGTKLAKLQDVPCHIPVLEKKGAESLNEAYEYISTVFEPDRRSKGGSTFLNIYFFDNDKKRWRRLDDLRGRFLSLPH